MESGRANGSGIPEKPDAPPARGSGLDLVNALIARVRRSQGPPFRGAGVVAAIGLILSVICASAYTFMAVGDTRFESGVLRSAAALSRDLVEAEMHCQGFLDSGDKDRLQSYLSASDRIDRSLADLDRVAGTIPLAGSVLVPSIRKTTKSIYAWRDSYARRAIALKLKRDGRKLNELNRRGLSTWLSGNMHEALATMGRNLGNAIEQGRDRSRLPRKLYLGGALLGLALLVGAGSILSLRGFRLLRRAFERGDALQLLTDWAEKIQFVTSPGQAVRMLNDVLGEQEGVASAMALMLTEEGSEIATPGDGAPAGAGDPGHAVSRAVEGCPVMRTGQRHEVSGAGKTTLCVCPLLTDASLSKACIPLLAQGRTVGLVHLTASRGRRFPLSDLDRAEAYARLASLTLGSLTTLARAEEQATMDGLTGVFNRRFLDAYLDKQVQLAKRQEEPLAVLMLDLDHFKEFNDRHGHPAGDLLLKELSRTLSMLVRDGDLVARYGGEEFAVVLPRANRETAVATAERIRGAVEGVRLSEMQELKSPVVTVSIGVACLERASEHAADLLRIADAALYRAKEGGRNRVECAVAA